MNQSYEDIMELVGRDYAQKCPICHDNLVYLIYTAATDKVFRKGIFNVWEKHKAPVDITDVCEGCDNMNAGEVRYFCPHCGTLLFENKDDAWNYMIHGTLTESTISKLISRKLSD